MADFKGRFRVYNSFLEPEESDLILSVGCKGAYFERNIVNNVNKIYAIDIDKSEIEKNKLEEPRIVFGHCDITEGTGFSGNHFDKVIFSEVIEHLPEGTEATALKEINRVLKKDGLLLISTPNDHPVSRFSDPVWWLKNHRHYRIEEIRRLLEESGFRIEKEFIGGGYLQSFAMPFFYLICILHAYKDPSFDELVDHEYADGKGFWTMIIKARKIRE